MPSFELFRPKLSRKVKINLLVRWMPVKVKFKYDGNFKQIIELELSYLLHETAELMKCQRLLWLRWCVTLLRGRSPLLPLVIWIHCILLCHSWEHIDSTMRMAAAGRLLPASSRCSLLPAISRCSLLPASIRCYLLPTSGRRSLLLLVISVIPAFLHHLGYND